MRLYLDYLAIVLLSFTQCKFVHLSREENQIVDALATLTSIWESGKQLEVKPLILAKSRKEIKVMPVDAAKRPWFYDL